MIIISRIVAAGVKQVAAVTGPNSTYPEAGRPVEGNRAAKLQQREY